jgi:hypothetical protein
MARGSAIGLATCWALSGISVGCYDWDVGPLSAEAGVDAATTHDAPVSLDAGHEAAVRHDAHDASPHDASDAGKPAVDAMSVHHDASSCAALLAAVDAAVLPAIVCSTSTTMGVCSKVLDPCGCAFFVGDPGSSAAYAYSNAVAAVAGSGCHPDCAKCPTVTESLCLPVQLDSGIGTACSPP